MSIFLSVTPVDINDEQRKLPRHEEYLTGRFSSSFFFSQSLSVSVKKLEIAVH